MATATEQAFQSVIRGFCQLHPGDVAAMMENLPASEVARLLEELPPAERAPVFERLTPDTAARALDRLNDETARELFVTLEADRVAMLLSRLSEDSRERELALLSPQAAKEIQTLLTYPPDSGGQLMDPRVTTFRGSATVAQVIERIRALGRKRIQDVFLVDDEGHLTGAVSLQDIVLAEESERLDVLKRGLPLSVHAMASREEVVEILSQHKLASLPVVDVEGRLLGVIRHEGLVNAVEQEASAGIQSMVGVSKQERALSPILFAVRKRLPWLQINLATAFLAASVVGLFESTIAQFTALAVLLPVVAGQSGNTGAQSLAVTMRGLTLREIRLRHWPRVTLKEATVGAIDGIAVAIVTCLGVYFWSGSSGLSLVIGLAMVASMAIAGVAGAAIPMILSALGQDPAQSSSIILTTVTDVFGFFSFLGLATVLAATL